MNKHQIVRMCTACRKQFNKQELVRLQKNGTNAITYRGVGRSFYLCHNCINNDKHFLKKVSGRLKINISSLQEAIKEFKSNVKN